MNHKIKRVIIIIAAWITLISPIFFIFSDIKYLLILGYIPLIHFLSLLIYSLIKRKMGKFRDAFSDGVTLGMCIGLGVVVAEAIVTKAKNTLFSDNILTEFLYLTIPITCIATVFNYYGVELPHD
jgi:hypothetical protein